MTLRIAFSLGILVVASWYTWVAFTDFAFMDRWRPGPGFFPRIIGVATLLLTVYSLLVDVRKRARRDTGTPYLRDILIFFAYCFAFVFALQWLGGLLAMVAFMLAALFTFNRGRTTVNLIVSVVLPIGLYLIFDVWLNAAVPVGRIPVPW